MFRHFVQLSWFIIVSCFLILYNYLGLSLFNVCFVISYNYLGLSLLVVFWFRTIILVYHCSLLDVSSFRTIIFSCFLILYNYLGLSLFNVYFVQLSWFIIVSCFLISCNYLGLSLLDVSSFHTIILVYHC